MILAGLSVAAGFINAAPLGIEKFKDWVDPQTAFPSLSNAAFDYPKAVISVASGLGRKAPPTIRASKTRTTTAASSRE